MEGLRPNVQHDSLLRTADHVITLIDDHGLNKHRIQCFAKAMFNKHPGDSGIPFDDTIRLQPRGKSRASPNLAGRPSDLDCRNPCNMWCNVDVSHPNPTMRRHASKLQCMLREIRKWRFRMRSAACRGVSAPRSSNLLPPHGVVMRVVIKGLVKTGPLQMSPLDDHSSRPGSRDLFGPLRRAPPRAHMPHSFINTVCCPQAQSANVQRSSSDCACACIA